ncbi:MAG: hypothetical protein EHM70_21295, partial [Chloroflexota bacterium]
MKQHRILIRLVILAVWVSTLLAGCASPTTQVPAPTQPPAPTPTQAPPPPTDTPVVFETLEPWELIFEKDVDHPVRMAAFIDQNFGLTGGANMEGQAHLTTDGGQTWTQGTNSSGCLFAVDVL